MKTWHRLVWLLPWLVAGCMASGPPKLRGLIRSPMGVPDGRSAAEWATRLAKAKDRGQVVTVTETQHWVFAGGIAQGNYVDIEWQIGSGAGAIHDGVVMMTIGRLRDPVAGSTLAEQAAALGLTLAPATGHQGVLYRLPGQVVRHLGPNAWAFPPNQEDYHDTTDPEIILLTRGGRISGVLRSTQIERSEESKVPCVQRFPRGQGLFWFKSREFLAREEADQAAFAERMAQIPERPPEPPAPVEPPRAAGPLPEIELPAPKTGEQAWTAAHRVLPEAMAACDAAVAAGDAKWLEQNWVELARRYRIIWHSDGALSREEQSTRRAYWIEWDKYLRGRVPALQAKVVELFAKHADESERRGLLATAVWLLYAADAITNRRHEPRPIERALRFGGASDRGFARAQYLAATLAVELVPAQEGIPGARSDDPIHPTLLVGRNQLARLARERNLPVLELTVGPWEGELTFTTAARPRQSTYNVRAMVPNTAGIEAWTNRIHELEQELANSPGEVTPEPESNPDYEVGQRDVFGGRNPNGTYTKLGTVGYREETRASKDRRERQQAALRNAPERSRANLANRRRLAESLAQARARPPEAMILGTVARTWTYQETCQVWTGTRRRALTVGGEKVVQSMGGSRGESGVTGWCKNGPDAAHNVPAADTWIQRDQANALWVVGADDEVSVAVSSPLARLITRQLDERIERHVSALRARGINGAALDREQELLRMLFVKTASPAVELTTD